MKAIRWKLQHSLLPTNIHKRKLKKVLQNEQTVSRRVWKFKKTIREQNFKKELRELFDVEAPNLWNTFKNGILKAYNEVCEKNHVKCEKKRNHGDTWWWNEHVKEAI